MIELTNKIILDDIAEFQKRIHKAKIRLNDLPPGHLPYQAHKKRERARRILEGDLKHVQNLIHIAENSLIDV